MNTHQQNRSVVCTFLGLALALAAGGSASAKSEASKEDKKLAIGIVTKIEKDKITLRKEGKDAEEVFPLDKEPSFSFVGFKGIGQAPEAPQPGFSIKANAAKDGTIKSALFSPPIPPLKKIPDRHKKSPEELFQIANVNKNSTVDFVEYATWIFQSYKHLPDRYKGKLDTNGDDVLDPKEFTESLNELSWWTISRKTADEWVQSADKDKSGGLNLEEAKEVTGGAHGKHDQVFKKLDRDKSGELSAAEVQPFLDSTISKKDGDE